MTRLKDRRYEHIKRVAVNTLIECGIRDVPIDPFLICERRGYKLIKYSEKYNEEDMAVVVEAFPNGFNYYDKGVRIIEYNDNYSIERIRTTILHEIGHIELKHTKKCLLAETEAEWFAAYIIAPPPLVDLYDIEDILDVSARFNTSCECGFHCMRRYQTWKRYTIFKKDYERQLVKQFTGDCISIDNERNVITYECN